MGAWGAGTFENDTALDWVWELEETSDLSVVEAALQRVLSVDGEYLEAGDAEEALAAIEVIARLQGNSGEPNDDIDNWVSANNLQVPPELAKKSHAAIERILGADSELAELWEDSDSFEEWKASVAGLKTRIRV